MLNRCSALVFSADGRWSEAFCTNLMTVGFYHTHCVCDFDDLEQAISKYNINYCFFSQSSHPKQIEAATNAIRNNRDDQIRFSPIILMANELSRDTLGDYLSFGFDDILQFPCTIDTLRNRSKRQLNSVVKYYETGNYFGPDRRNYFNAQEEDKTAMRKGETPYRRYLIRRDIFKGLEVVDTFDYKPPAFVTEEWNAI